MATIYTPGGVLGPFTKPNVEPAKGHWAIHQAYSSKNHAGSAAQDAFRAARIYIDLAGRKLPVSQDTRLNALLGVVHSKDGATGYIDFLLSGLSFGYQERSQLQVAQNDNFVEYYFGSTPATINLQGVLFNTMQDDWSNNMLEIYWNVLRGTKMAARRALVKLRILDRIYAFTLRSFSENFSTSSTNTTGFSLSGTLYSIQLVPSDAQHILPTDVTGLARNAARGAASSRVANALRRGEGNAMLSTVQSGIQGLLFGPEVAPVLQESIQLQLGGVPLTAGSGVPTSPTSQPTAPTPSQQASVAGVTKSGTALRATNPVFRTEPSTSATQSANTGVGQVVTSSPTRRTRPGAARGGAASTDYPYSSTQQFHSLDPGAEGR